MQAESRESMSISIESVGAGTTKRLNFELGSPVLLFSLSKAPNEPVGEAKHQPGRVESRTICSS